MTNERILQFDNICRFFLIGALVFMVIGLGTAYAEASDPRGWGPIHFGDSRSTVNSRMHKEGYKDAANDAFLTDHVRYAFGHVHNTAEREMWYDDENNRHLHRYFGEALERFSEDSFEKQIGPQLTMRVVVYYFDDNAHSIHIIYKSPDNDEEIKKAINENLLDKYGKPTYHITIKDIGDDRIILPQQMSYLAPRDLSFQPSSGPLVTIHWAPISNINLFSSYYNYLKYNSDTKLQQQQPIWCIGSTLIYNAGLRYASGYDEVLSFEDLNFVKDMIKPINKYLDMVEKYYKGAKGKAIDAVKDSFK